MRRLEAEPSKSLNVIVPVRARSKVDIQAQIHALPLVYDA